MFLLQSMCFRTVTKEGGTTKQSSGCRNIDTCPFAALPSSQSFAHCEENDGTETCLTCDYFDDEGFSRCKEDNPCVDQENNSMDLYCYTCTNEDGALECNSGNFEKCGPNVTIILLLFFFLKCHVLVFCNLNLKNISCFLILKSICETTVITDVRGSEKKVQFGCRAIERCPTKSMSPSGDGFCFLNNDGDWECTKCSYDNSRCVPPKICNEPKKPLQCLTCENVRDDVECYDKGSFEECSRDGSEVGVISTEVD